MSEQCVSTNRLVSGRIAFGTIGCLLCAVTLLAGCVAEVRVPPPPPPRVYAPPPPPPPPQTYAPQSDEAEMQASEPPPPLPDYEQPPPPDEGYLWTPGYWAFGPGGYYWVPGTWVEPPRVGVLWTPGYWGFVGAVYVFHAGYWGPHVGFYGGVNYGFGYGGAGYAGGRWVGNSFAYNRSVTNITNVTVIHNTYNETVVNNVTVNKVSYNGGAGGVSAVATAQERQAAQEPHVAPTPVQRQHVQEAAKNPSLFAKANGGRPAIAATPRPAVFNAPGVVGAHGAATPPPHPMSPNPPNNLARPGVNPSQQVAAPKPPATSTSQNVTHTNPPTAAVRPQVNVGKPPPPKPAAKTPPAKTPPPKKEPQ